MGDQMGVVRGSRPSSSFGTDAFNNKRGRLARLLVWWVVVAGGFCLTVVVVAGVVGG